VVTSQSQPEETGLGHGHFLRWASWRPDRHLNPQYAHLPDVERCTALIRHDLLPGDAEPGCVRRGYCEAAATLDGPVTMQLFPEQARWQVLCMEPLTLSPSLLCHCGDHGYIQGGRWEPC
jgi:hypothetical protein